MKIQWLVFVPILALAGLAWKPTSQSKAVADSTGSQLSDDDMKSAYGGIFTYCGGPTCPNVASCHQVASGTWEFYYNN